MSNEKKLAKQQEKERKAELKRQATADKLRAKALAAEEKTRAKLEKRESKRRLKEQKKGSKAAVAEVPDQPPRRNSIARLFRPRSSSKGSRSSSKSSLDAGGSSASLASAATATTQSPPHGSYAPNIKTSVAKESRSGSFSPAGRKPSGQYGFGPGAGGFYRPKTDSSNVLPEKSMTHFAKKTVEKGDFASRGESESLEEATAKAQEVARQKAAARQAELEAANANAEKKREEAKLEAARKAAAKAAGDFMTQTGKAEPAPAPARGLPAGLALGDDVSPPPQSSGSRRGLPMGAMLGDDDDKEEDTSQGPAEPEPELSFEEMMNKAMELEADDKPDAAEPEEEEKPPEPWEVWRGVNEKDAEEIEALADCGADFNLRDGEGRTPLHKATDLDAPDVIEALVKGGADINAKTEDGLDWTALHIAALSGYPDSLKKLLELKADTTVVDARKETPLQWAEANHEDECIALLKDV